MYIVKKCNENPATTLSVSDLSGTVDQTRETFPGPMQTQDPFYPRLYQVEMLSERMILNSLNLNSIQLNSTQLLQYVDY